MVNRDRTCVWRETLPLLHVSRDKYIHNNEVQENNAHVRMYTMECIQCTKNEMPYYTNRNFIQYQNLFTGPPKVKNATFGNTRVVKNVIWQDISWSTVQLRNEVTKYLIKSASSSRMATALPTIQSNIASYTLKLKVPTSNTTFTVWVAAIRNRAFSDLGDFSDPQFITYTSMFSEHYLHYGDTHTDCHTHPLVLHCSSWSTSRPDTCQQNLSQHHIPVVPT